MHVVRSSNTYCSPTLSPAKTVSVTFEGIAYTSQQAPQRPCDFHASLADALRPFNSIGHPILSRLCSAQDASREVTPYREAVRHVPRTNVPVVGDCPDSRAGLAKRKWDCPLHAFRLQWVDRGMSFSGTCLTFPSPGSLRYDGAVVRGAPWMIVSPTHPVRRRRYTTRTWLCRLVIVSAVGCRWRHLCNAFGVCACGGIRNPGCALRLRRGATLGSGM
jgi:hypothetical protein